MKKLILVLLSCMLIAALLPGCAGKPAAEQSSGAANVSQEDQQKAAEDVAKAMEAFENKGWPKDKLPSELPEYSEGEIINSGGDNDSFYVKIDKTNKDALSAYLVKLKDLSWHIEEGSESIAEKGIYELRFDWQSDDHLQMALYTSEVGAWPADKLPSDIVPPTEGTLIGGVELTETVPGQIWYTNYTFDGINEEKAKAYTDMLISKGWSGDSSMISKDMEWNGKKYHATIELYETNENSSTFTLNLELTQ